MTLALNSLPHTFPLLTIALGAVLVTATMPLYYWGRLVISVMVGRVRL